MTASAIYSFIDGVVAARVLVSIFEGFRPAVTVLEGHSPEVGVNRAHKLRYSSDVWS